MKKEERKKEKKKTPKFKTFSVPSIMNVK